ncbi:rod shape-determining protein RodA [Synergistales bacterium]|nr:rod shape-determining protein RodA [Synergistales bacterium]
MLPGKYSWSEIRGSMDKTMLALILVIFAIGLFSIYSAEAGLRKNVSGFALRQSAWGAVSIAAYFGVLSVGYDKFLSASYWIYAASLVVLLALEVAGTSSHGAQGWFRFGSVNFQPAEFCKVAIILLLARLCSRHPPETIVKLLSALALSGVSAAIVMKQPDLGSALVFSAIIFAVIIVAGAPYKYIGAIVAAGFAAMPFLWGMLKQYQKMRLVVFLDPYVDPQGAGYNVIQSRIAVGSGGMWGKGFMHGTQGRLHFLPEPHTDFIFSVFAEEFGFIGGVIVIALFAMLFWRILRAGMRTKEMSAKLICVGVSAWLWFQVMESIAMSMGLAPITGLPMPLFSYGGSSLLMEFVALALVQSIAVSQVRDKIQQV